MFPLHCLSGYLQSLVLEVLSVWATTEFRPEGLLMKLQKLKKSQKIAQKILPTQIESIAFKVNKQPLQFEHSN